jgi:hypothetical protein
MHESYKLRSAARTSFTQRMGAVQYGDSDNDLLRPRLRR